MMRRVFSILCASVISAYALWGQGLTFDKTSHDFGQVVLGSGAVKCNFKAVNNTSAPVTIQSVTTSCGCTNVQWQHEPVQPGAATTISASYTNDEGPFPFDKTLTVKIVGQERPVLLRLRGRSVKEVLPDSKVYTTVFCDVIGFETDAFKLPNIEQGSSRGDQATVANLSSKPVILSFANVSEGLSLTVSPNPIPAGEHAVVNLTVKSSAGKWGTNVYSATPVADGRKAGSSIKVSALTCTPFSSVTREQKSSGSRPLFEESTFSFGHKKQGSRVEGNFSCRNAGKSPLTIYKIESDCAGFKAGAMADVPAGGNGSFTFSVDTSTLPKGEALVIVSLITNSPMRPVVNLFVTGWID